MKQPYRLALLATSLLLLAYFSGLHLLELRAEEPRRAVVALEMWLSGNWIVPTIHGEPYYNKPPLFNWALASFFSLFQNSSEWVVRLPSLLMWWASTGLLFLIVRRYLDIKKAVIAALFLLTFGDMLFYGSVNSGEIDLFFSGLIFGSAIAVFHFGQQQKWLLLFFISYLLTALATLTKGLPAIAFHGFGLLAFAVTIREWKWLFSWQHLSSGLLFCSLVGSYFWAYDQQHSVLPYLTNLLQETTQKTATESNLTDTLLASLAFFPNLLKLLLPWSLLLLALFKKSTRVQFLTTPILKFAALFIAFNIWIYVFSPGNYDRYLYPFFPFFALLLAQLLFTFRPNWSRGVLIGVCCIAVLRITYNAFGMSYQQRTLKNLIYRDLHETLNELTKDEPIYWTGNPYQWTAEAKFLGQSFGEYQVSTPPLLPYQLPYYASHRGNYIMAFHEESQLDTFYLAYLDFVAGKNVEILYQFQERWTKREMVLVKFMD